MEATFPRKNADVMIDAEIGGVRIAHNAVTRKYFKLGMREAAFLESLDGAASPEALRASNCSGFNAAEVDRLIAWFGAQGLLAGRHAASTPRPATLWGRILAFVSGPDRWRIHLFDPNDFLDRHLTLVHGFFSRFALLCYLIIFLLPVVLFASAPMLLKAATASYTEAFSAFEWGGLYLAVLLMIAFHEMAHAVACKHYGGEVHRIGIMLLYLQPVMYCDVSDSWRFRDTEKKIAVAAAGIFVQILVSCLVISIWTVANWPVLLYFAVVNAAIAVFNFFPFVKLDGYWMLVHVLNEPNLRKKSFQAVERGVRRLFGRKASVSRERFSPLFFTFGVASLLAFCLFWALGFYAIYHHASRFSEGVAVALMAVFAGMTVYRTWAFLREYAQSFKPNK